MALLHIFFIGVSFTWIVLNDASNQIRGLDDTILFRMNWPGYDEALLDSPYYEKLEMTSTNNEKFQCLIPVDYGVKEDKSAGYTGKDAFSLLFGLFTKKTCTLRLELYWTYEICHGGHIKQYHETVEGKTKMKRIHEYTLGKTTTDDIIRQTDEYIANVVMKDNPDIPTTKVDGVDIPYVRVDYTDGTYCELTGQPRISHILYVCFEEGRHEVYTIKEVFTCEYEIVVLSPILCQHPAYRPRDSPQTDLHCISMTPGPKRPRNLIQYEAEGLRLLARGGKLTSNMDTGALNLDLMDDKPVMSNTPDISEETKKILIQKKIIPKSHPPVDQKLMQDFLNGDYCLHGGTGWWKHEFCYGKKVDQYHEDRDGSKIVINLGLFDTQEHLQWMLENPNKQYREGNNQVSHFYSKGSICDVTGKPRVVEVKLKCNEGNSPSSFSLYLHEPDPCHYVLGIETSIICPLLQYADSAGLFELSETQAHEAISSLDTPEYKITSTMLNDESVKVVIINNEKEKGDKSTLIGEIQQDTETIEIEILDSDEDGNSEKDDNNSDSPKVLYSFELDP